MCVLSWLITKIKRAFEHIMYKTQVWPVSATNEKYKEFLCFEKYADRTNTVCELSCDTEFIPRAHLSNPLYS